MNGPAAAETVEHVLAAIWGCGIDNLSIEIDGPEIPSIDGSPLLLEEGEILSGQADPHHIAARLAELYPGALVMLKLDDEGAYLYADGEGTHFPTSARTVVDATGAGDAYAGAFLAAWLRGAPPAEAARGANRLAGWVVERFGARPEADAELEGLLAGL